MNTFAISLVLMSTVMHAGWNLLARTEDDEGVFFIRMLLVSIVIGFVPFCVSEAIARSIPPKAWLCVLGSGTCCGLYYVSLAAAYRSGDFTTVYPVARALPVLLVGLFDAARGRSPTTAGWVGMAMVASGAVLAPLHSFRDVSLRRYLTRSSFWIVLTALGTVGYSTLDKLASEAVHPGPASAARYGYAFFAVSFIVYLAGVWRSARRQAFVRGRRWDKPALAALLNFGAYWLVLWAYQLSRRAGYVVAFRQFGIIIAVLVAFAVFREQGKSVRLTGTLLITAGLALIAIWGM